MREQLVELARNRARKAAVLAELEDVLSRDRGTGVTIEQVLWAGAVIVIVGIVVAAIKFFVTSESAKIK